MLHIQSITSSESMYNHNVVYAYTIDSRQTTQMMSYYKQSIHSFSTSVKPVSPETKTTTTTTTTKYVHENYFSIIDKIVFNKQCQQQRAKKKHHTFCGS